MGALNLHPQQTQNRFSNPQITEEDIYAGVRDYLEAVESKNLENWFCQAYGTSKMLINAWSRFVLQ
jgi:hypothetical protein